MQPHKIDTRIYPGNPNWGKPTNVCLLLVAGFDYNNTTIILQINPLDIDQNTHENYSNSLCKLDRQTLDPSWIQQTKKK